MLVMNTGKAYMLTRCIFFKLFKISEFIGKLLPRSLSFFILKYIRQFCLKEMCMLPIAYIFFSGKAFFKIAESVFILKRFTVRHVVIYTNCSYSFNGNSIKTHLCL